MQKQLARVITCLCAAFVFLWACADGIAADESAVSTVEASENDTDAISAPHQDTWRRYTRGFRKEHNFAVTSGITTSKWDIGHFGSIENEKYSRRGIFAKFQYSFHLPLYQSFGAFLGSSFGYYYESTAEDEVFQPAPTFSFPGILAGFALNLTPVFRTGIGLDYYLERWNGMREHREGRAEDTNIHITVESLDLTVFIDIFYKITWAFRLEGHQRQEFYRRPQEVEREPSIDITFKRNDFWLGAGLVYHLL